MSDRGYINLLSHLHRPSSSLPINAVTGSLAHYLSKLQPSPTPLAATAISSPFFLPLSHAKLSAISTAFRHAIHLKSKSLEEEHGFGLFKPNVKVQLREWVWSVLKGFEGGAAVLRLACAGGLLLGLGDLQVKGESRLGAGRDHVEDEVVVALAEVMELYEPGGSAEWGTAFQPAIEQGQVGGLSLALISASQSLALVSAARLRALPLPILARHLTSTIAAAFASGSFLDPLGVSISSKNEYRVYIPPTSPVAETLPVLMASPLYESLAPLSKLSAHVHSVLLDAKPVLGLPTAADTLASLASIAAKVEDGWIHGGIAEVSDEDIEPSSREKTTAIWTALKTLLFSSIMVANSILAATVYVPPSSYVIAGSSTPSIFADVTPHSLSLQTLSILSHLSFVITQFGGVTTTATSGAEFPELKKTFYVALDVLSDSRDGKSLADTFVRRLCTDEANKGQSALHQAKKAFALACIEQLVPILNQDILPLVFETCFTHLNDPSHRETYESAHSVVLAMFAAHARTRNIPDGEDGEGWPFMQRSMPFYAKCLIENSGPGRLSAPQLRLAYSSLVASASSGARHSEREKEDAQILSRYCVDLLSTAIASLGAQESPEAREQAHSLRLTLVSTLPSLTLGTLEHTLQAIQENILSLESNSQPRKELVEALFSEIMERVGDEEKQIVMRWWYEIGAKSFGTVADQGKKVERGIAGVVSRL